MAASHFLHRSLHVHLLQELNMATTASPMVMSDGTLIVSCAPYPNYPARASWRDAEIGLLSSNDGGQTFSYIKGGNGSSFITKRIFCITRARAILPRNFMQGPSFAVSPAGTRICRSYICVMAAY